MIDFFLQLILSACLIKLNEVILFFDGGSGVLYPSPEALLLEKEEGLYYTHTRKIL